MLIKERRTYKTIALFLVFAVAQVCVQASGVNTVASPVLRVNPKAKSLMGRLSVQANRSIKVNSSDMNSGGTVFSGSQIETPAEFGASVQLESLGNVTIAPSTNLTLIFDKGNVMVDISAGDALLTTEEGVKGLITTPDGQTQDPNKPKQDDDDDDEKKGAVILPGGAAGAGAAGAGAAGATAGGLFGLGTAATVGLIGAAAAAVTFATLAINGRPPCVPRGANPSPGEPRGRPCP